MLRPYFLFILSFLFVSTSCFAEESANRLAPIEQVSTLRALFEKNLVGAQKLQKILPAPWLLPGADLSSEVQKLQTQLLSIREKEDETPTNRLQIELLNLKLQWVSLSPIERSALLEEALLRAQAKQNDTLGVKKVEEASEQLSLSKKVEQQIDLDIEKAESERESFLLQRRLNLEKYFQSLQQSEKNLGEIRQTFSKDIQVWTNFKNGLSQSLEDESLKQGSQSFESFRANLRARLDESNSRVWAQEGFGNFVFGAALPEYQLQPIVQIRETDSEKIKALIHEIQAKRVELESGLARYASERREIYLERVLWEKDYRQQLFTLRGGLIRHMTARQSSPESIWFELRSVGASASFWIWSWRFVPKAAEGSVIQERWEQVSSVFHLIKLLLLSLLTLFLLFKRKDVLRRVQDWFHKKVYSYRKRQWVGWGLEFFSSLYVFLVLILLGSLLIEFGVEFGLKESLYIKPYLETFLIFFFIWGMIGFVSPFVSQRKIRYVTKQDEVMAMERTFEFVPKLFLTYWLLNKLSSTFFFQFLDTNLIHETLQSILLALSFVALVAGVWWARSDWRLVSEQATDSLYWRAVLRKSQGKLWEPFVLLFGGGLGVYLLAWKVLKARLSQLEVTRSFQAMFSRALLERKKRNSLFRVAQDRFPRDYLNFFNIQIEAKPEWYVDRSELHSILDSSYKRWQEKSSGTTVLITGDRGVGKSELVRHFLRSHQADAKFVKLRPGDTAIQDICEVLSQQLLNENFSGDQEGFVRRICELEPSIISLENLENCLLRKVGGFKAFSFALDFILRTSGRHLWLVSFTPYAWTIAKSAVPGADCFSHHLNVRGMSEEEIKSMILKRHESAENHQLDFSELSFSQRNERGLSKEEAEEKRKNLYFRILWDYTDGNPRQALYFWKTSILWSEESAKVSLFDVPEQDILGTLNIKTLMALAALVEHNGLTLNGLKEVMNESDSSVRRWMEEMSPYGILYSFGDARSERVGWHLESFWMAAVESYLEKRHLLFRGGLK